MNNYPDWLTIAEKNRRVINREFSKLKIVDLNRIVHIHGCSIKEMLTNLMLFNDRMIEMIEKALATLKPGDPVEYRRGMAGMILLRLSRKIKVKPVDNSIQVTVLFQRLQLQQQKIKELITLCMQINPNTKIISQGPLGIFKISIGNAMEYLLQYQNQYLILARQILMLQNL